MRNTITCSLISASLLAVNAAAAPRHAEELEQLRTNTGYVIEQGELEMDVVLSYFDYEDARHRGVEVELEYGLSDRLMLEVEVPYGERRFDDTVSDIDGYGNVEVGAKWLLTDRDTFAAALNVAVVLPSGSDREGIAEDSWGLELSAPVSFQFPDQDMSLHIEPGVEWLDHEGVEEQFVRAAVEYRAPDSSLTLQLGANVEREESEVEAYLIPSLELAAADFPLQVGIGIPVGITSESADWGVLVDLEVEF